MPTINVCFCGCGRTTKSKFAQGHDSKFHSRAKTAMRSDNPDEAIAAELASLPHDEARAEFTAFIAKQQPKEDARKAKEEKRQAAIAQRAAERAAKKAQEEADKAALKEVAAAVQDVTPAVLAV